MEWPIRKELLDRAWKRLDPEEPAPVENDAPGWRLLSRPLVHVSLLLAFSLLYHLARLGTKVLEGDEATYALLSKTITLTGDWTHLSLNGEIYLRKPPLYFWLGALVFKVFPITAWGASLVSALFGVADTVLLYAVCRAMFPGWVTGFAAALVYLTTHEVLHWSRGVHIETLVNFWLLLGLLAVHRSLRSPEATLLLGLSAAGGWLAKGPQGLYLAAVAWLVWMREGIVFRRLLSPWALGAAGLLIAAVAGWIWAGAEEGKGVAEAYFVKQIGYKFFGPALIQHGALFYFRKLFETYWPWLPAALIGGIVLAKSWKKSPGARIWLIYGGVVLLAILVAAERRVRYLFQLYPALSVAAGVALAVAFRLRPRLLLWLLALVALGGGLLVGFGARHASVAPKTQETVLVARRIQTEGPVWITESTQHGRPSVGRILGFYAAPLLQTCKGQCGAEAVPGSTVIARAEEADEVTALIHGEVTYRNGTLAIVVVPERS